MCTPKHQTFWRDNGSRSNSRTCAMFCASKSRPDGRRNTYFYGINLLRKKGALLMVEHCRRQRHRSPSSTLPLLLKTSKTKPVLVRDTLQWPKNSQRVFQKATASDGKLNSDQASRNSFSDK